MNGRIQDSAVRFRMENSQNGTRIRKQTSIGRRVTAKLAGRDMIQRLAVRSQGVG